MYGDVGYRRRYGARSRYYNRYGYAGAGVGSNAGPVAVGSGYGAALDLSQLESGYNAQTASHYAGQYGIAGSKKRKEGERTPFWSTIGDIILLPIRIATTPFVGTNKRRDEREAIAAANAAGGGIAYNEALELARARKLQWRGEAEQMAAYIGQGNIGTAAAQGEQTYYSVGAGPVVQYDPMQGQPGVAVAAEPPSPWIYVGAAVLVAGLGYAILRK